MSIKARFMTPSGKFRTLKEEIFKSTEDALNAVKQHYEPLGFRDIAIVDDVDFDCMRVTGTTPGGRGGRNLVFLDYLEDS